MSAYCKEKNMIKDAKKDNVTSKEIIYDSEAQSLETVYETAMKELNKAKQEEKDYE